MNGSNSNSVCFLVFSDDFGEHPSSCQHIFNYISKDYPVLWVNTIGMRNPQPTLRDLQKIILKVKGMLGNLFVKKNISASVTDKNISICQPVMLPFLRIKTIRNFNRMSVVHSVKKDLVRLGYDSPIIVTTAPNACDYLGYFNEKKTVFYCVDDFSEWPGLDKELVLSMENDLIDRSDVFIATSHDLKEKIENRGKHAHLLTHGVEYDHFSKNVVKEHDLLSQIPKPRVGYFGLFDRRSNLDLLAEVAKALPHVSFVITGNIEVDVSRIDKIPNIYFTGGVPYPELPDIVAGWEICMLPYNINKLTDAIQPLKIKEYMATGKAVISTPIAEAVKLKQFVCIASSAEEWANEIRKIIENGAIIDCEKRSLFLDNEGWEVKAREFLNICFE